MVACKELVLMLEKIKYIYDCAFDTRGPKKLVLDDHVAHNLFCDIADDLVSEMTNSNFVVNRKGKTYKVYIT
jgi:hypothetical protein